MHGKRGARRPHRRPLVVCLGAVLGLSVVAAVGVQVLFDAYTIPGRSMEPTLEPGDRVLAWGLDTREPRRGDIVIFEPPPRSATARGQLVPSRIGRVVAVGGDRIASADGRLTRNNAVVDEPYLSTGGATERLDATVVPAESFYVLGDNRVNAEDSRIYGPVADASVQARVAFTNLPLDWITLGAVVVASLALALAVLGPERLRAALGRGESPTHRDH